MKIRSTVFWDLAYETVMKLNHKYFDDLAESIRQKLVSRLPDDPNQRMALFIETMRVLSYRERMQNHVKQEYHLPRVEYDLLFWGWNYCAYHLYSPVKQPMAVPLFRDDAQNRTVAESILMQLGVVSLLKRTAELIKHNLATASEVNDTIEIEVYEDTEAHFWDVLDGYNYRDYFNRINDNHLDDSNGWILLDRKNFYESLGKPGAYLIRNIDDDVDLHDEDDIFSIMKELVFPWDSGFGIMTGYDAVPEVDDYYMILGTKLAALYRDEAGFHPHELINDVDFASITIAVATMLSLHLKHIRLCELAAKKHHNISFYHSLVHWAPKSKLLNSISDYYNINENDVVKVLEYLVLTNDDICIMDRNTTPLIPLMIDTGSDHYLYPTFSLKNNPFDYIIRKLSNTTSNYREILNNKREEWMRNLLYSQFYGSRYYLVDGNIRLRDNKNFITDIDAAVYDYLTGTVALIQLKWQDYNACTIPEIVSKTRNLRDSVEKWVQDVSGWVDRYGTQELCRSMRLRNPKRHNTTKVLYFAVSHSVSRTYGYGHDFEDTQLALCNLKQFIRIRAEVGPSEDVLQDIYDRIKDEHKSEGKVKRLREAINVDGRTMIYNGFWNEIED